MMKDMKNLAIAAGISFVVAAFVVWASNNTNIGKELLK